MINIRYIFDYRSFCMMSRFCVGTIFAHGLAAWGMQGSYYVGLQLNVSSRNCHWPWPPCLGELDVTLKSWLPKGNVYIHRWVCKAHESAESQNKWVLVIGRKFWVLSLGQREEGFLSLIKVMFFLELTLKTERPQASGKEFVGFEATFLCACLLDFLVFGR